MNSPSVCPPEDSMRWYLVKATPLTVLVQSFSNCAGVCSWPADVHVDIIVIFSLLLTCKTWSFLAIQMQWVGNLWL